MLECGLNAVTKPKDDERVAEKEDVLECGYASPSFPDCWAGACTALSTVEARVPDWKR